MAAILFLFVILAFLLGGRAQAQSARDGSELRFPVWELALGVLLLLLFAAHFAVGTPLPAVVEAIAAVGAVAVAGLPKLQSRRDHDIEDF